MGDVDTRLVIELCTTAFSAYTAYSNMALKNEIMRLKFWIIQNFHAKDNAELDK
jgi:hypothetical protein